MIPKPKPFFDAVQAYPEFKDAFKRFCSEAARKFNANEHLPNLSFTIKKPDDVCATLRALDRDFDILLRFIVVDSTPWGVIEASLPGEANKEPVRLLYYFFDHLGNVFKTLTSGAEFNSLSSTEFLVEFHNQLIKVYFDYLAAILI